MIDSPRGRAVWPFIEGAGTIHVPHLAIIEAASALRRWTLRGEVEPATAAQAVRDLERLDAVRHPHEPFLERIWSLRENVSAYDAVYVAMAEALGAPLVTCDERLGRAPLGIIVEIVRG